VLRMEIEQSANTATLRCSGRMVQGDDLDRLSRTAKSQTTKHLILDLADVTSIDAGGLGELVELQRWATDSARRFTVLNPSARVRELVVATNLQSVLDIRMTSRASSKIAVRNGSSAMDTLPLEICAADM